MMKTNYTVEEWTDMGMLEDVPVHRTEQVVHALNYALGWIDRKKFIENTDASILPMIVMTIATIIDVNDADLEKILDKAFIEYGDHMITYIRYHTHVDEVEADNEFTQEFVEKIVKQHKHKLQLN